MVKTSLMELAEAVKERMLRCKCMTFRRSIRDHFDNDILRYISRNEERLIFFKFMENLEKQQKEYGSFEVNKQFASQINDLFRKRDLLRKSGDERISKKELTEYADFLHILGRLTDCNKETADFVDGAFDEVSFDFGTGSDGKTVLAMTVFRDGARNLEPSAERLAKLLGNAVVRVAVYGMAKLDVYP